MIADRLIGSDEDGGLSLEQRKRTTLGVELAANPSVIFLDGPSAQDSWSTLPVLVVTLSLHRLTWN